MKSRIFINSSLSVLLGISLLTAQNTTSTSAIPNHPSKLTFKPLGWTVPLGNPYRTELKNGLIAYIAEDNTLPIVQVSIYTRSGTLLDPKGREGMTNLMTTLMRTGGTRKYPADTLNELIELYAMKFRVSASESQITFSASFLSEYSDKAIDIMEQILFYPVFEQGKLEKERKIMIQDIKHQFDNPGPTLKASYRKHWYSGEMASRLATEKSLKNITREDLINLHKKTFKPGKMILAMSGDFNRDSMLTTLEKTIKDTTAAIAVDSFPQVNTNSTVQGLIVHKPISQAYVRLGLPLFKRPHPDFYAMSLLNEILGGGGFTSRLGTKIRSDAGLTYSIYSNAESNYTYPATFYIEFFTKNASFSQAVAMSILEVQRVIDTGVTKEELENAKASLTGQLPSMFRSPYDVVATYAWNEYYGRDPEHYKLYEENIKKITLEDINRVAKQYLKPEAFTYTVVGDTSALMNQETGGFSLSKIKNKIISSDSIAVLP